MCIRDTKWLQEKLISINTLRWTHPGWRESRLSVCEWTADTPVYIPQREKSHLPTRKWADRSSTINWRVRLRRMFLPRGRNTHTHTHTHTHTPERSFQNSVKNPNLHGTDRVSESERRRRRSLTFLAFQPNFCDMNPFENVQNRQRSERQVDMLEERSDTSCRLTDEECPCGYRL